jgi:leader peptidase (prepilin peptidase)/N-methyltransferase
MEIIDLLSASPTFLLTVCIVLGMLVGSFLNVVVYRLPIMLQRDWREQCCDYLETDNETPDSNESSAKFKVFNLQRPDSHCPLCNHKIKPWENVPVLSYLFLGGKCSDCKAKISIRYPSVELASGALSGLVAFHFGATWLTLALLLLTWALIALTLIDFDHQLLPDNITLPLIWLGLLVNTIDLGFGVTPRDAVIGAIVGYIVLWVFYWGFKLATGKDGMGYGDFKLLSALGAEPTANNYSFFASRRFFRCLNDTAFRKRQVCANALRPVSRRCWISHVDMGPSAKRILYRQLHQLTTSPINIRILSE